MEEILELCYDYLLEYVDILMDEDSSNPDIGEIRKTIDDIQSELEK